MRRYTFLVCNFLPGFKPPRRIENPYLDVLGSGSYLARNASFGYVYVSEAGGVTVLGSSGIRSLKYHLIITIIVSISITISPNNQNTFVPVLSSSPCLHAARRLIHLVRIHPSGKATKITGPQMLITSTNVAGSVSGTPRKGRKRDRLKRIFARSSSPEVSPATAVAPAAPQHPAPSLRIPGTIAAIPGIAIPVGAPALAAGPSSGMFAALPRAPGTVPIPVVVPASAPVVGTTVAVTSNQPTGTPPTINLVMGHPTHATSGSSNSPRYDVVCTSGVPKSLTSVSNPS